MTDELEDIWVEIRRCHSLGEAEQFALVLAAKSIEYRLMPKGRGIALLVAASAAPDALRELAAYVRENNRPRRRPSPIRPVGEGIDGALAYCAVLVLVQSAAGRGAFGADWYTAGQAQAGLIIGGGEWWRAITALGLHADFGHLAANVGFGSLFAILLSQIMGPGIAWLAILIAGGLGNWVNALVHPDTHTAVGASTAVFAALGLLAALMWKREPPRWARGPRRLLPLAAGAMLLVFLGAGGERTDVGAHVAGFAVGVLMGALIAMFGEGLPRHRRAQLSYGGAALGLFVFAWMIALSAAPPVE